MHTPTLAVRSASAESTGSIVAIALRTCAITSSKATRTPATCTPSRAPPRASTTAEAAAIRALLGTHPVHRQSPPGWSRSTISTDAPSEAALHAPTKPAVPSPTTSRSHTPPCGATGTAAPPPS